MSDEKEIKQPSGESLSPEQKIEFYQEGVKIEKKESTREELFTKEALKREIDKIELEESLKGEADEKAQKIQTLGEEEKIEHLLETAKNRGIVFAIRVGKQMNDDFALDTFRDILVKEWETYKQFLK
jgi:hypothetical protein